MSVRLMKHNPAFLTRDELIRGFVVRQADLEILLERLRENRDAGPSQHLLIIGPRGMGKTTLVRRAAASIAMEPELTKKWYPLIFGEESYEVATAAEFWLEAVMHLGQQTGDERWKTAHRVLREERDEQRLYEKALARLMDFADEQGKKLLVIVENLNMILGEQLSADDGWTLRHTLQNEPRITLLATATSRFDEIDNVNKAMYDLFWCENLVPLDTKECRTLWKSITGNELTGDRIRPVEILTGGSPRLLSILASFAGDMSLHELMDNLTQLVDDHTSYFKSNLEVLPVTERKVYVTLADLWSPATAREVATAARIDVNKASALLHRLQSRGAVAEVKREGRTISYQVTERLYNIYHLMRRHGGEETRVRAVVDFMVHFYEESDLAEDARGAMSGAPRDYRLVLRAAMQRISAEELRTRTTPPTHHDPVELEDAPEYVRALSRERAEMQDHLLVARDSATDAWNDPTQLNDMLLNDELSKLRAAAIAAAAAGQVTEALATLMGSHAKARLEPLVVALQILDGQSPNAPQEIAEIAKDIIARIEQRRQAASSTPAASKTSAPRATRKTTKKARPPRRSS